MKQIRLIVVSIFLLSFLSSSFLLHAQVGVGTTTPNGSAMLDVTSTTKGFLPPRVTSQQRDAITSPAIGLMVWCTNCASNGELDIFNGNGWQTSTGDTATVGAVLDTIKVGDRYLGGVVAYIDVPGDSGYVRGEVHGIIASIADLTGTYYWCNGTIAKTGAFKGTYVKTGAVYVQLGDAALNTSLIIDAQGTLLPESSGKTVYYAAYAAKMSGTGWSLPDLDELEKLNANKSIIGGFTNQVWDAVTKRYTLRSGTKYQTYWSSSAVPVKNDLENKNSAVTLNFNNTGAVLEDRATLYFVRPVKKF